MINIINRIIGQIDDASVANDKEVIKLDFQSVNQVTPLLKLSECDKLYINYQNEQKDRYLITDLTVDGDNVTFSWLLGANATKQQGKTYFIVCAQKTDGNGTILQEWNSELAFFNVHKGLETVTAPTEELEDIFSQLVDMIDGKQPLGDYATKTELNEAVADKLKASNLKAGTNVTLNVDGNDVTINASGGTADAYTKAETDALLDEKQNKGDYATESELTTGLSTKQNTLTAGAGITIQNDVISASTGTTDYADLENKPQINSITLSGNKSLSDLGIQPSGSYATSTELTQGLAAKQDTLTAGQNISISGSTISATDTTYSAGEGILVANDTISADLKQSTGQSTTGIMSQKAVTDELSGKLSNPLIFTNKTPTFTDQSSNPDTGFEDYTYKGVISNLTGVTADMLATVIFADAQALSGKYSLTCLTGANSVTIYSNDNTAITIPTVIAGLPIEVEVEGGGDSGHNYSTTEQVVGTWIDGKPLYERTIKYDWGTSGTLSNNTPILTLADIDFCMIAEQYFIDKSQYTTSSTYNKCISMFEKISTGGMHLYYDFTNMQIKVKMENGLGIAEGRHFVFVIHYTKTTDTAVVV